jgi:hypothetical protein
MSRKGCLIWLIMMMMTVTVMVLKAMKKMLIKMMERRKKERGRKKNWKGLRCSRVRGTCYLIHKNLGGHHFRCESSQFCKYECLKKAHEECISNASLVSCQTEGLRKEDAELLVYLIDEEMDIYIGIRRCLPPWFCRPNPFSYLGVVAVVYRTEKRQKEGSKDFTVHSDVRRTPEKGLRAVSRPTAVPISADISTAHEECNASLVSTNTHPYMYMDAGRPRLTELR